MDQHAKIDELTTTDFWDNYWKNLQLPSTIDPSFSFDRSLAHHLSKAFEYKSKGKVLEIGAAPGKWLAHFASKGDFVLSGIEYSQPGAEALKKNLQLLNLKVDKIIIGDFFEINPIPEYDIVMSYGFIEHFSDPENVIERHLKWLKPNGLLILGVPNFRSIHGLLQKALNPEVLRVHNLKIMDLQFFKRIAGMFNLKLITAEYLGSFESSLPIARKGITAKTIIPKIFLKLMKQVRRIKLTDRINAPWWSSYILAIYEKR